MLEDSLKRMDAAAPEARAEAERMAETIMTATMIEDLIPAADAQGIVANHRASSTEEWQRMVHACLLARETLRAH